MPYYLLALTCVADMIVITVLLMPWDEIYSFIFFMMGVVTAIISGGWATGI